MGFADSGRRKLMIRLFYPRASKSPNGRKLKCRPAGYAPGAVIDRLEEETVAGRQVDIKTGVCQGGQVARGLHPVILLSHAYTATGSMYTSLASDLASRGFILAAIDRTYEAFAGGFPSGPVREGVYGGPFDSVGAPADQSAALESIRADDASFVLTFVDGLSDRRSSPLWKHVDRKHSGIMGHSLGGATAFETANKDSRFDAAVNLDGEVWNDELAARNLKTPHLLLLSEAALRDTFRLTLARAYYGRQTGPKQALLFAGTKHYAFSDFQSLSPQVVAQYPEWPYASQMPSFIGTADPASTVALERRTLARYFKFYLGKKKSGAPQLESGPALTTYAPPTCLRPVP